MSLALIICNIVTNPLFLLCVSLMTHGYIALYVSLSGIVGYNYSYRQLINFIAQVVPMVYIYVVLKEIHTVYKNQADITTFATFSILASCILDIAWNKWH